MMKNKIGKFIRNNIVLCVILLVMIVAAVVAALLPPLVLKSLVDEISSGQMITWTQAVTYFIILAAAGLIDAYKEVLITKFGQAVTRSIRQDMCCKLDRLGASYFTENATGNVVSIFISDVDTIQSLFSNGIISMVIDGFQIISIFIVIFYMSKGLGMLMIIIVPLIFFMTRAFQKRMLDAQYANRKVIAKVTNHIPETIKSIRTIQNTRRQKFMENKYNQYLCDSYDAVEKSNFYDSIYSPIIITISAVVVAVVMLMSSMGGSFQSFFGMTAGTAVAIIAYVDKIFAPIESLGMEIQNIQEALAGLKRVRMFMSEEEEEKKTAGINDEDIKSGDAVIRFDNVKFGYNVDSKVLDGVSFDIKNGENVTLAGRTGCGKSTSFKLILGLYSADAGNVYIYGKSADSLSNEAKRDIFGYVEQSFHMIDGTVRDQITLGDDQITDDQVRNAAALVGLDETIMGFEKRYDEKCTESLFSQGQFQLLSIARAVVKNPKIMLLDEITANLDSETEKMVLDALSRAQKDRTVVSISHRIYEKSGNSRLIEMS